MNKVIKHFVMAIIVASLLLAPLANAQAQGAGPGELAPLNVGEGQVISGQYIVVLKPSTGAKAQGELIESLELKGIRMIQIYTAGFRGFTAILPEEVLLELRRNPLVEFVETDRIVTGAPESTPEAQTLVDVESNGELEAAASQLNPGWGLDRVDQRDKALDNTYNFQSVGAGVHIYVISSGIRSTHVEFSGRASKDFDGIGDGKYGDDTGGAGTMIASMAAGTKYGLAKAAQIHAVRNPGSNLDTISSIIAGIDWVTANHLHPAVAATNLVVGASAAIDLAVTGAINHGITFVAPPYSMYAQCNYYSPGRVPAVITVSTSDQNDNAFAPDYGTPNCIDLYSPGTGAMGAYKDSDSQYYPCESNMAWCAVGYTAGVAALYLQWYPMASPAQVSAALVAAATPDVLEYTGSSPNLLLYSLVGTQPVTPSPVSPNGASLDNSPAYSWTRIPGASAYEYQIYKGSSLLATHSLDDSACEAYICKHDPGSILPYGTDYKWNVRAMVGGTWRMYGASKLFIIPNPVLTATSPVGDIGDTKPKFVWKKVSNALRYEVKLFKGATLIETMVVYSNGCVGSTCSVSRTQTLPRARGYSWQMRANIGGSWTAFTARKVFNIISTVPTPIYPENQIYDTTPTFSWTLVGGATEFEYRVRKGTITKYSRVVQNTVCADPSCVCHTGYACEFKSFNYLPYGTFSWQVRAKVGGLWKPWSTSRTFSISAPDGFINYFSPSPGFWELQNGTADFSTSSLTLDGVKDNVQSILHANNYSDFSYEIVGETTSQYRDVILLFHAQATPLNPYGDINNGYEFAINGGTHFYFGFQKDGYWYWLIQRTYSPAIRLYKNKLKVTTSGGLTRLYINDVLVAAGNLSTFTKGQVGIAVYPDPYMTCCLYIRRAALTVGAPTAASTLEEGVINLDLLQPVLDTSPDRGR